MTVDVRRIDRPERRDLSHLERWLDDGERERLARFRRSEDRRLFVAAHAGLRLLLGERLDLAPGAVRLGRAACPICGDDHGRPVSLDDPEGTHFSISHADGMVVLAVADVAVGVDVEPLAGLDLRDDLDSTLHPEERGAIDALPADQRAQALLSCWVRTEAYLKGLGTGLGVDPATISLGPARPGGEVTRLDGWTVVDLDVGPTHLAALALADGVEGPAALGETAPVVEPRPLPAPGG